MENKRNILLCVSGGIAAYKAIDLCSRLYKSGYQVKTILTHNACEFIAPINFSAISHNTVHTEQFGDSDPIPHISLSDWADLIVIAPATANILAKAAHGIADDLLSSTLIAHQKPILFVPAMNVFMFENVATQENIAILRRRGHIVLEPATGMLACAYEGKGKYPPNTQVMLAIQTFLHYKLDLFGKRIMVTAGATKEAIDPMRFISNKSSGKMGFAIANAAALRGAQVFLVHTDTKEEIPYLLYGSQLCNTVDEMYKTCLDLTVTQDWIIMCAAVSDYKVNNYVEQKIKKTDELMLHLVSTPDILSELGKRKRKGQILVGFAAETENIIANAKKKLKAKKLDLIVSNHLSVVGRNDTEVTVISEKTEDSLSGSKFSVAHQLLDLILVYEK